MSDASNQRANIIRALNDSFRTSFVGGRVVLTQGVADLPLDVKAHAILAVQGFEDFEADNDPHREHDFGSFKVGGETLFWKLDYYNENCSAGSEDPADPKVTTRVLTIGLVMEY